MGILEAISLPSVVRVRARRQKHPITGDCGRHEFGKAVLLVRSQEAELLESRAKAIRVKTA